MIRAGIARWVQAPLVTGWSALLCGMVAVWIPTMVRLAMNGTVTGCEFTPYLPFVLISAVVLRWWKAALVALASVAVLAGLFESSPAFQMSCLMPAAGMFLASSTVMIGFPMMVRRAMATQVRRTDGTTSGLIFSVEQGDVWASWHGQGAPVRLGSQRAVYETMEDFLAQGEAGKPLADR
jgi:hypothetical protein